MTEFELTIFTKVKELTELKKEAIIRSATEFIYNPAIKQYDKEIAEILDKDEKSIDNTIQRLKSKICGKTMEGMHNDSN